MSERAQSVAVTFAPGTRTFSADVFRSAVAEAGVEVLALEAEVCGRVDSQSALRSSADAAQTLVRLRGRDVPPGISVCARGRLDDTVEPYRLDVVDAALSRREP